MYIEENEEKIIKKLREECKENCSGQRMPIEILVREEFYILKESGEIDIVTEEMIRERVDSIVNRENDSEIYGRLANIKNVSENLIHLVDAWLNNNYVEYQLNDEINMEYIIRKVCNYGGENIEKLMQANPEYYLEAIFWMDKLTKKPEMIEIFKRMNFIER